MSMKPQVPTEQSKNFGMMKFEAIVNAVDSFTPKGKENFLSTQTFGCFSVTKFFIAQD